MKITHSLAGGACLLVVLASAAARDGDAETAVPQLVVHEWGTFTSVAGADGMPVAWRPLSEGDDLPRFVYSRAAEPTSVESPPPQRVKPRLTAFVRLETPVVYFYAPGPMRVSFRADLRGGQITEWYPAARVRGGRIGWDAVEVRTEAAAFPEEAATSHYYAARDTDAAPVRVPGPDGPQDERFLFYRGVGALRVPLFAWLHRDRIAVQSLAPDRIAEVVVFENRGGEVAYTVQPLPSRALAFPRPRGGRGLESLRGELEAMLVRHGLYPREASAMVATWGDSWFEEGLRVFYVLPRAETDAALPVTVDPAPAELVRVMVVRTEILTDDDERRALAELRTLPDADDPAAVQETRRRLGRFGEPVLRRTLERGPGPGLRAKIEAVLARP